MPTQVPLSQAAQSLLQAAFGANSLAYQGLISAAGNSPYFSGLLNQYAENQGRISLDNTPENPAQSTMARSPTEIWVNADWLPGSGKSAELDSNTFAVVLAHELGHTVSQGGYGNVIAVTNPDEQIQNEHINEGVALTTEYIVATQLNTSMGSDRGQNTSQPPLTPQLTALAFENEIDIQSLTYGSSDAQLLTGINSAATSLAGVWNGTATPSGMSISYDEYNADWFILANCTNLGANQNTDPLQVNWSQVQTGSIQYSLDSSGQCSYSLSDVPLIHGGSVSGTGEISGVGTPISLNLTLSGDAGTVNVSGANVTLADGASATLVGYGDNVTLNADASAVMQSSLGNIAVGNSFTVCVVGPAKFTQPRW